MRCDRGKLIDLRTTWFLTLLDTQSAAQSAALGTAYSPLTTLTANSLTKFASLSTAGLAASSTSRCIPLGAALPAGGLALSALVDFR